MIQIWAHSDIGDNKSIFSPFEVRNQFLQVRWGYISDNEPLVEQQIS